MSGPLRGVLVLLVLIAAEPAAADLGRRLIDERIEDLRVVAYVSPAPLRAGPTEWTLFVLDGETGRPDEDASLSLHLHPPSDASGDHAHGTMIDVRLDGPDGRVAARLPTPGEWHAMITIETRDGRRLELAESVSVEDARRFGWADLWAFAIPYAAIGAFLGSQRAALRRRSASAEADPVRS